MFTASYPTITVYLVGYLPTKFGSWLQYRSDRGTKCAIGPKPAMCVHEGDLFYHNAALPCVNNRAFACVSSCLTKQPKAKALKQHQ